MSSTTEWSVLLKLAAPPPYLLTIEQRDTLADQLHDETTADGGGADITLRTWIDADDAGEAGTRAATQVNAAAAAIGLPPLRVIRLHATSPALRVENALPAVSQHRDDSAWGVIANARLRGLAPGDLTTIESNLPGGDARVTGAGDEIMAQWWVDAETAGQAAERARSDITRALGAAGHHDFHLFRIQPASLDEQIFEVYPGADDRNLSS